MLVGFVLSMIFKAPSIRMALLSYFAASLFLSCSGPEFQIFPSFAFFIALQNQLITARAKSVQSIFVLYVDVQVSAKL